MVDESVYLRAIEKDDLERTFRWHNDPNLYKTLIGPFRYVSRDSEGDWLNKIVKFSTTELNLAICIKESDQHIGNLYLRSIDWVSRNASIEMLIGEIDCQSKGFGQSALRQIISDAFLHLGLNRVMLRVLADNKKAIHVYQKMGFIIEGTLRSHVYKEGVFRDVHIMGLCKSDIKD